MITKKCAWSVFAPNMKTYTDPEPWESQKVVYKKLDGTLVVPTDDHKSIITKAMTRRSSNLHPITVYTTKVDHVEDYCHAGWWGYFGGGLFFTRFSSGYKGSEKLFQPWMENVLELPQYKELTDDLVLVEVGGYSFGFFLNLPKEDFEEKKHLVMNFLCMQRAYTDMQNYFVSPTLFLMDKGFTFDEGLFLSMTLPFSGNLGEETFFSEASLGASSHLWGHTPLMAFSTRFLLNKRNTSVWLSSSMNGIDKHLWWDITGTNSFRSSLLKKLRVPGQKEKPFVPVFLKAVSKSPTYSLDQILSAFRATINEFKQEKALAA